MSHTLQEIESVIKQLLVDDLEADAALIANATASTPLLGRGIGLDSIEALRLGLGLENAFHLRIPDRDLTVELFANLGTLTNYILQRTNEQPQNDALAQIAYSGEESR